MVGNYSYACVTDLRTDTHGAILCHMNPTGPQNTAKDNFLCPFRMYTECSPKRVNIHADEDYLWRREGQAQFILPTFFLFMAKCI